MGENHNYKKRNEQACIKLLDYFAKNKNVKTVLFEIPFSQTYLFNEFKSNPYSSLNVKNGLYTFLYNIEFNEIIDKYGIKVIGIDVDEDIYSAKAAIQDILEKISQKNDRPIESLIGNNIFRTIKENKSKEMSFRLDSMFFEIKHDTIKYKATFGEYFKIFYQILEGFNLYNSHEEDSVYFYLREYYMFNKFSSILKDSTYKGNFFGKFGCISPLKSWTKLYN